MPVGQGRLAEERLSLLGQFVKRDALGAFVVSLESVKGLIGGRRRVIGLATNEAAEERGNDGLSDDDLIV